MRHTKRIGIRPVVFLAAFAAACGCGAEERAATVARSSGQRGQVLDAFASREAWSVDASEDPAALSLADGDSLRIVFGSGRARKVAVRRDLPLDLSETVSLSLDVWVPAGGLRLALGLVTGPGHVYHETAAAELPAGWSEARFRLNGSHFKTAATGWECASALADAARTERLLVLVYSEGEAAEIRIKRLSFEGRLAELPPDRPVTTDTPADVPPPPSNPRVLGASTDLRVFRAVELRVAFDAAHESPFDPEEIDVYAEFVSPSGGGTRVNGFVDSAGEWRVRYMPLEAGRHEYVFVAANGGGRASTEPASIVVEAGDARPPVVVSAADPTQFERLGGQAFYPVGLNVCWASDFDRFFERFSSAGGNTVRVWLAPWSIPLTSGSGAGAIDLEAADKLDGVLDMAAARGLSVQLVLIYHGEFTDRWRESPWNALNGGPCREPEDFFSSSEAKASFKRLLRYAAARYSAHESMFAWELMNEADLAPWRSRGDVAGWHREMADYLRQADHLRRPITTSVLDLDSFADIESLESIDFLQAHVYRASVDSSVRFQVNRHSATGKPYYLGEFGAHHEFEADVADSEGVRLSAGLWMSLASPAAGTAMPWWWDVQIDAHDLYRRWRPIGELAPLIERRGRDWRFFSRWLNEVARAAEGRVPSHSRVQGIVDRTEGLLYFFDSRTLEDVRIAPVVAPTGALISVGGLSNGRYAVDLWRGLSGARGRLGVVESEGRSIELSIPPIAEAFAIHFRRISEGGSE